MLPSLSMMILSALSAAALAQAPTNAPANPPVRLRGTAQALEGTLLSVKGNDGQLRTVRLKDDYVVTGISKAGIVDIVSGNFIGTTTLGKRDGALAAPRVNVRLSGQAPPM